MSFTLVPNSVYRKLSRRNQPAKHLLPLSCFREIYHLGNFRKGSNLGMCTVSLPVTVGTREKNHQTNDPRKDTKCLLFWASLVVFCVSSDKLGEPIRKKGSQSGGGRRLIRRKNRQE